MTSQPEFILFDNKFLPAGSLLVTADNRCFRYGDGLFETMKLRANAIKLWTYHIERLHNGFELLQFKDPLWGTDEQLLNHILQLIKLNGHQSVARIRLQVFRGDGNIHADVGTIHYVVQSFPLPVRPANTVNGIVAGIHPHVRKSCDVFAQVKSCNFLPYTQAAMYAKAQGWNDCLVLNQYDRICDSSVANVFWVHNNNIFTPSIKEGPVAGVFRRHLLHVLKDKGFSIEESIFETHTILEAHELFLTNAVSGIQPVSRIGDKQYSTSFTQEIEQLIDWQ